MYTHENRAARCFSMVAIVVLEAIGLAASAQPVIYGLADGDHFSVTVERLDLATGQADSLTSGDWLYSLALDKAANVLYIGGPHILRYNLDTSTLDTLLTNRDFRALHGHRGGTPCDHRGIALDTLKQQIYGTGECWGGPHLIRINLDGTGLEWIDGIHGLDVAIDYDHDFSFAFLSIRGNLTRYRTDIWHPESLVESEAEDVEVDHLGGKVYWHDGHSIMRANLNGTDFEYVLGPGKVLSEVEGIALDPSRGDLYYSSDKLYRIRMDGSERAPVSDRRYGKIAVDGGSTNTAMETDGTLPNGIELLQSFPNPFKSVATITYSLSRPSDVKLSILDVTGRIVRLLDSGTRPAGTHRFRFDAGDLPAGMYFCRLETGESAMVRSLVLAR